MSNCCCSSSAVDIVLLLTIKLSKILLLLGAVRSSKLLFDAVVVITLSKIKISELELNCSNAVKSVTVIFFTSNLWSTIDSDFYVYSDADLELNQEMPYNWQEIMLEYYNKHNGDLKIALSLRLDDIPDHYEFKDRVKAHQNVCWYPTEEENVYRAISDLQFCFDSKTKGHRYDSLRLAGKFMARHVPWYLDFNNIDEEEKYYIEHINPGFDQAMYSFLHHGALKSKS
jgi:hypothetical protein